MLLFVAYQLWGTNLYEAAQQDQLRSQFDQELADARDARAPVSGTTTTTRPLPPPPEGEPLAVIQIPKLGVDRVVVQGITVPDLRKGPGHYPDSPLPGQVGNVQIAGHRTTYGAPFNRIDELVAGDEIVLRTLAGTSRYRVTEQLVVSPRDVFVLDQTPDATLTLTTCHPKYSARQRLVVKARLDADASPPPVEATIPRRYRRATSVQDLAGRPESRVPVVWSALLVALIGAAWWWAFHRHKRWYVWVLGAIPFLAAYALFCFFLERVLPPGF
jgi:sortase A